MTSLQLNPQQVEAITYTKGPLLVIAGAGSGKTRVITNKIAHLIQHCNIKANQIAAVTFTNKAAREMKSRVNEEMQGKNTRGLMISTFHTLGLNILRREIKQTPYRPNFSIYDSKDCAHLLQQIAAEMDDFADLDIQISWQISHWKNAMILPEQAVSQCKNDIEVRVAKLYQIYQEHLTIYNAMDFDDLILQTSLLFAHHPEVLLKWQNKIKYLLVDEYQDTNKAQYQLIKQITQMRNQLTAVGDDDQSIYTWRGANPENLSLLAKDFPELKIIRLEQNYRSTSTILNAANQLISNNPHLFSKKLWSNLGRGEKIRILCCTDGEHEASLVTSEILHQHFQHKNQWQDYAILYRSNHQARIFEKNLREQRIPYRITGGPSFFDAVEVKDVLAYLKLFVNPDDNNAFLRIINTPKRGIGRSTIKKLQSYSESRHTSLIKACQEMGLKQVLSARSVLALEEFSHWYHHFCNNTLDKPCETVVKKLLSDIAYLDYLDANEEQKKTAKKKENVAELLDWLSQLSKDENNENKSISDIIAHLTLVDILDRQDDNETTDQVTLMTLHAAKGLEFPHVYLVGIEEDIIPHRESIKEGNLEEERRLAYVGITRAKQFLTLSFTEKKKRYGETISCAPSRFIDELPKKDLTWRGGKYGIDKKESQQKAKAHLASIRELLAK